MIEPLFASSLWPGMPSLGPGVPSPAFGWPQIAGPIGNRAPGAPGVTSQPSPVGTVGIGAAPRGLQGPGGLPTDPYSLGTIPGLMQPGFVGFPMVPNTFGLTGAFPPLNTPEIAAGYSLSTLLMTIAMRRGQPMGPSNDQEIEDFIYDVLELLPGASDVEVRSEGGRATLTGSVQHKRLKRDVGEVAWAIPGINDVQNNVTIATKRRSRTSRETEQPAHAAAGRKQP